MTREGTAQCPSNRLGQSLMQRTQTDACRTAASWRRALSHLPADRLQQDRLHRLCEPPTAQIVDPPQTEDHGIRNLPPVYLSTRGFHSCFTWRCALLQVIRKLRAICKQRKSNGEGHMPLTNVGNSTSPNSTEFCRPMPVIYGEKTFQSLHQRPAILLRREWWISTLPVSYGK